MRVTYGAFMFEVSAKIGLASEKEADPWPRAESELIPSQRHSSEDTPVVLTRPSVLMQSGNPIDEKAEEKNRGYLARFDYGKIDSVWNSFLTVCPPKTTIWRLPIVIFGASVAGQLRFETLEND